MQHAEHQLFDTGTFRLRPVLMLGAIARCLEAGLAVTVFAETERELRRQSPPGETVTIERIESDLIRQFNPRWNRR
jgi:hypothetical protein